MNKYLLFASPQVWAYVIRRVRMTCSSSFHGNLSKWELISYGHSHLARAEYTVDVYLLVESLPLL